MLVSNNRSSVLEIMRQGFGRTFLLNNVEMGYKLNRVFKLRNTFSGKMGMFRDEAKEKIMVLRTLQMYDKIIAPQGMSFEFIGKNLAVENTELAQEIFDYGMGDGDYSHVIVEDYSKERAFVSMTYKVNMIDLWSYAKFVMETLREMLGGNVKKAFAITYDEFASGKKDGQRLGRFLSRQGISQKLVGDLDSYRAGSRDSEYLDVQGEMYFTISGASQHIIGQSSFGVDWSSCQDFLECDDDRLPMHSWATSQTKEAFVAFTHNKLDDLNTTNKHNEFMLTRTTVMRQEKDGKELFFHGRTYGNLAAAHDAIVDHFSILGHFHSYNAYDRSSSNSTHMSFKLEHGNMKNTGGLSHGDQNLTIEFCVNDSYDVCCPLCDGDGEVTATLRRDGDYLGERDIECPHCEGTGEISIDVEHDIDESDVESYGIDPDDFVDNEQEDFFSFYDDHAFEGFQNNYGNGVQVYADKTLFENYMSKKPRVKVTFKDVEYLGDLVEKHGDIIRVHLEGTSDIAKFYLASNCTMEIQDTTQQLEKVGI